MRSRFCTLLVLWVAFVFPLLVFANENERELIVVRHPYDSEGDAVYVRRMQYFINMLELALDKSGLSYRLQVETLPIATGSRSTRNLQMGRYDIHWLHTTRERERKLLPIRIPLYKGLIGWRLLMINAGDAETFSKVDSFNHLRFFYVGLGHDWPDTFVMRENGFKVKTAIKRESLYNMLQRERTDFITRSVLEVWDEQEEFDLDGVVLEPRLALRYSSAFYFFVNRDNTELAELVERGLEIALRDGSFDALFWKTYGAYIEKANLPERKIIEVANPLIPEKTPIERAELWFTLDDLRHYQNRDNQ